MSALRKVTVHLPADLIEGAQRATGAGLTETMRQALKAVIHSAWSRDMLALEGRLPLLLDLDALRDDGEPASRDAAA